MIHHKLLQDIKARLQSTFGPRFQGIVLYGSEVKNKAAEDSDIDLMVILDGPIFLWEDTHAIVESVYDLQLQILRPLHMTPVSNESFKAGEYALYRNAKNEGISI